MNHVLRQSARAALVLIACAMAAGAELAQALQIIDLRHRPAEQVLPQVQALVGARGSATGTGFKLFVRADAATLADVRRMLAAIDVPQRRLMISVRQADTSERSRVEILSGARIDERGARIVGSADARSDDARGEVVQRVQALEGSPAFINVGEQRMQPNAVVNYDGGRRGGNNITVLPAPVEANTGFYVLPRVNGDAVLLEVSPQREAFGPQGEVRGHALSTQAGGRLGEWIDLGATEAQASGEGTRLGGIAGSSESARMHVQIKVEELK